MTEREKITTDRKYKNSTGEVRVLCVDAGGEYPVVCLDSSGNVVSFTADGRLHLEREEPKLDLIPIPETRTVWVNVYDDGTAYHHDSEEQAREWCLTEPKPIAAAQPLTFEVNK